MVDRRTVLKVGGAATVAGGILAGAVYLSDDEPEGPTPNETETSGEDVEEGDPIDEELDDEDDVEVADEDVEMVRLVYEEYDEPGDVYDIWSGDPSVYSFVDNAVYSGETALRCEIPEGESEGANALFWFPDEGYGQPLEVRQRTMVRLSDDWVMEDGDVCRFWCIGLNTEAGPYGSSVRGRPLGDDGWSSMLAVTDRQTEYDDEYNLATYTYHMDQPGDAGEFEVADAPVRPGEWFELRTQALMNTITDGEADPNGEIRVWLDGELIYERTDFRWTTIEEQAVEYAGPLVRYGGGETAPIDLAIYYDEHELLFAGIPDIPEYEQDPYFEDPENMDEYDGRVTYVNGDDPAFYRLYVDGYVVHTEWSYVDGHQAMYNDTVEITQADEHESGYAVVEAEAAPQTVDGYFYDGEVAALDADPEPEELWIDGDRVDPRDVPVTPEDG